MGDASGAGTSRAGAMRGSLKQAKAKGVSRGGRKLGIEWEFVDKIGGGQWACKFCGHVSTGSATRIRAHIIGEAPKKGDKTDGISACPAPDEIRKDALRRLAAKRKRKDTSARVVRARSGAEPRLQQEHDTSEEDEEMTTPPAFQSEGGLGSIGPGTCSQGAGVPGQQRMEDTIELVARSSKQTRVDHCLASEQLRHAQQKVVEGFLYAGLSPHLLEHKAMRDAFQEVAKVGPTFKMPSYKHANNKMLDDIHRKMVDKVDTKLARVTESRPATLVTDGWSNVNKDHLVNYMIVYPGGEAFLKSVECKNECATASWIYEKTKAVIESFGAKRIFQVVMDNAANCKLAGEMLEAEFPGLHSVGCQCHSLNLLLKDWYKRHTWFKDPVLKGRRVVKFITKKTGVYAIYKSLRVKKLALMNPGSTRFASNYICLSRLMMCRDWIISTFNHTEFFQWERRQKGAKGAKARKEAQELRELVARESFWKGVDNVVKCMKPVYYALRTLDSSRASAGKVWKCWHSVQEALQHVGPDQPFDNAKRKELLADVGTRWAKSYSHLHGAGHALDPANHDMDQHADKEVMGSLKKVAKKYYPNAADYRELLIELSEYQNLTGRWADEELAEAISSHKEKSDMEAYAWWQVHGQVTGTLQALALTVLSLVSSNSASERNWSAYKYIHSVSRNRLLHGKADKLVFNFANWRLLNRSNNKRVEKIDFPSIAIENAAGVEEDAFEDSEDERMAVTAGRHRDPEIVATRFEDQDEQADDLSEESADSSSDEEEEEDEAVTVMDLTAEGSEHGFGLDHLDSVE